MWKPTLILATIALSTIPLTSGDLIQRPTIRPPLPKKLPIDLQHQRIPRGIYDPPPYTYEGDVPKELPTADDHIFRSITADVKANLHARNARSLNNPKTLPELEDYPKTFRNFRVFKGFGKKRIARGVTLPGPDFEVPKIPFIPKGGFPWDREQFDRVPEHRRLIG
ncbi:hypothetical protein PYW08_010652 [Mythimna loreyi]|uniref:Uncharacterized protein n=1 Tax=Mythimna loreyi TaxID=667449 RepID=A0ACC2Q445_9NEOP|nr:hypothetical protein PYW08_010652 [Mythimna loreyi]